MHNFVLSPHWPRALLHYVCYRIRSWHPTSREGTLLQWACKQETKGVPSCWQSAYVWLVNNSLVVQTKMHIFSHTHTQKTSGVDLTWKCYFWVQGPWIFKSSSVYRLLVHSRVTICTQDPQASRNMHFHATRSCLLEEKVKSKCAKHMFRSGQMISSRRPPQTQIQFTRDQICQAVVVPERQSACTQPEHLMTYCLCHAFSEEACAKKGNMPANSSLHAQALLGDNIGLHSENEGRAAKLRAMSCHGRSIDSVVSIFDKTWMCAWISSNGFPDDCPITRNRSLYLKLASSGPTALVGQSSCTFWDMSWSWACQRSRLQMATVRWITAGFSKAFSAKQRDVTSSRLRIAIHLLFWDHPPKLSILLPTEGQYTNEGLSPFFCVCPCLSLYVGVVCASLCMRVPLCVRVCVCVYVCVCTYVCVCERGGVRVCMYVYIYICAVELKTGPRFGVSSVKNWSKSSVKTGPIFLLFFPNCVVFFGRF